MQQWRIVPTSRRTSRADRVDVLDADGRYVAGYVTQADARLMAAAPDLLAALERIVHINGSTGDHKSMVAEFKHIARVAISKALGDTD